MSLKNGEMQTVAFLGTLVLSSALFLPVVYLTEAAAAQKADFTDMESIEASIAYKKEPIKQPQKQFKPPEVKKDEGVSHDENKKVDQCTSDRDCKDGFTCKNKTCVPKKDDKVAKVEDNKDPFAKFKHSTDDDTPVGKPTTQPGDFNGNEEGFAPMTKGHPFWQHFAKDIHENFTLPSISDVSGTPVGCFHIAPDGKIVDTKFKTKSGSDVLDDAAQRAIDAVKKLRNDNPEPVPTELLGQITRWICVRFDPKQAG